MRRIITLFILTFMLFFTLFTPSYADVFTQERVVYDRASAFTDLEIEEIEKAAKIYYSKSYASVYVVTDNSAYAGSYDGDDFLSEYGISGDAIVLIITDNSKRNYNIYPYGKCYLKISDGEYNKILDNPDVFNNIKSGNYVEGAKKCIELCEVACRPNVKGYIIGASIAVISIVLIFIGCTVYSYKKKLRSEKYPLNRFARLNLTVQRDDFITKFVAVQVTKSSSSSGGGSRGGGRSGR